MPCRVGSNERPNTVDGSEWSREQPSGADRQRRHHRAAIEDGDPPFFRLGAPSVDATAERTVLRDVDVVGPHLERHVGRQDRQGLERASAMHNHACAVERPTQRRPIEYVAIGELNPPVNAASSRVPACDHDRGVRSSEEIFDEVSAEEAAPTQDDDPYSHVKWRPISDA